MKTKFVFVSVIVAALLFGMGAAIVPNVTATFFRFQCDPQIAADGTVTAAPLKAFWKSTVSVTGQTFEAPMKSVEWDANNTTKTVTIHVAASNGNVTLTDGEIIAAVMASANREKNAATPLLLSHPR
jgi:hypothetical protein